MESSVGLYHSFNDKNTGVTIKIKENIEDFIVQEVIETYKCEITSVCNLKKFEEAEKLFEQPLNNDLNKEERIQIYDIAGYHPFKRLYRDNGNLFIENNSTDVFVFTLLKYDYSDMAVQRLLAKKLNINSSCIQTGGTKDRHGITLQEISVKCSFENLFNYAISLSKNKNIKFENLGYCEELDNINDKLINIFKDYINISLIETDENIGIYNIRRGHSKKLGDLSGNYFTIKLKNFFDDIPTPTKFYNYFGTQRFGNSLSNHLIGEMILKGQYEDAINLILKYENEENSSYLGRIIKQKLESKNKPRYIIETLQKQHLMLYLHSYQSYLFNMSVNSRIESNKPDIECDKVMVNGELINAVESDKLEDLYIPLKKMNHKFLKGDIRKIVEEIKDFEKIVVEDGTILKFFLPKSSYATVALREIAETIITNNK